MKLVESPPYLRFRITSGILITQQDTIRYWGHHMLDIVNESPDKDECATSGWSRDHTGKWMDPWHEMIGIVSVRNPKQKRIIGFQNIIGFFF